MHRDIHKNMHKHFHSRIKPRPRTNLGTAGFRNVCGVRWATMIIIIIIFFLKLFIVYKQFVATIHISIIFLATMSQVLPLKYIKKMRKSVLKLDIAIQFNI